MIISSSIRDVINYIEKNLEKPIQINDIVKYSGYSRRHIENLFTQHTSWSIGAYIRNRRLTRAAILLRLTRTSIIEIALILQFSSQQSFSREFKKFTQHTPYQYRKSPYWDTSALCSPLNIDYPLPPPLQIVELPEEKIFGYQINYDIEIPHNESTEKNNIYLQNTIYQQLNNHKKTIRLITTYSPSLRNTQNINVTSIIETSNHSLSVSPVSYFYGGGLYACFEFYCDWESYRLFHHNIYLNILPFYNIKRREGADVEAFFYDEKLVRNNKLKGKIHIPVHMN